MEVKATSRFVKMPPSKARALARKIAGLPVAEALKIVDFTASKAGLTIGKTLKSALANAKTNAKLPVDDLMVKKAVVDEGPRLKRYWPRARGSASPILKRMCHIAVVLTDDQKGEKAIIRKENAKQG
ncbi:MAG: 50S ribosomal protein L22 [Verrucomicrobiota bacterium]|nr:50S ribosomal protein L22 [Verrucomicrobiota bacterium]